ncbi:uncharacterized protein LOC122384471 [Amphibalanus amphitrite]|uniref:uncharacterized protein LOC122384471 n=1 Tax=Amphibalanus amphitrite TaxID=1232801 RepID=UPI001C91736F|nr:uncharacterized protein LOC122384471 [Amphibalanus amphitrite]
MSARSVVTAALLFALALGALGQRAALEVTPRCSRPFAPPAPSCFCSTSSAGHWTVTCGCPDDTFPAGQDVVLTPQLLPPAGRAADGLQIALLGCRRAVRLSAELLTAADSRFSSISLEVRDTDHLVLPERPDGGRPGALRFSSVEAHFERVSVPRITGALFSQRLSVNATFDSVEIGEIAAGAFHQTLVAPEVRITDSRVGRIARGAFQLPVGTSSADSPLAGLRLLRSHVDEWSAGAHVGGVLVHVVDSHVAHLRRAALSTVGLVELRWTGSTVAEAEAEAVLQDSAPPPDLLPPADLTFINNTFRMAPDSSSTTGLLHFTTGVPSALQFTDNLVEGAAAAPVTPAPRPDQVTGTRLQCRCELLRPWLTESPPFAETAQCAGGEEERRVAEFYQEECGGGRLRTLPDSAAGRLSVAAGIVAQLAVAVGLRRALA